MLNNYVTKSVSNEEAFQNIHHSSAVQGISQGAEDYPILHLYIAVSIYCQDFNTTVSSTDLFKHRFI